MVNFSGYNCAKFLFYPIFSVITSRVWRQTKSPLSFSILVLLLLTLINREMSSPHRSRNRREEQAENLTVEVLHCSVWAISNLYLCVHDDVDVGQVLPAHDVVEHGCAMMRWKREV